MAYTMSRTEQMLFKHLQIQIDSLSYFPNTNKMTTESYFNAFICILLLEFQLLSLYYS